MGFRGQGCATDLEPPFSVKSPFRSCQQQAGTSCTYSGVNESSLIRGVRMALATGLCPLLHYEQR